MDKIKLDLIGITYNQIESGVYAVILQQSGGTRKIPIIIGFPEAQAIECKLQEVITPRPLTHDLMVNVISAFGVMLKEVNIYKMSNGVFAAELVLTDGERTRIIDSRSSDAIALAIRVDAPIYTTAEVLEEAGFEPKEKPGIKPGSESVTRQKTTVSHKSDLNLKSIEELKKDMQHAAESEDYERAAKIKEEIDRRLNKEENEK